jgi:hypothetical protein
MRNSYLLIYKTQHDALIQYFRHIPNLSLKSCIVLEQNKSGNRATYVSKSLCIGISTDLPSELLPTLIISLEN